MVKVRLLKALVLIGLMCSFSSHSLTASEGGNLRTALKSTPFALSTNMLYDAALVPNLGATIGLGGG